MNIDGISEQTANQFYEQLSLRTVADIYSITKSQLLSLDKFKDKKADNILNAIEKSKNVPLDKFIFSLGILNVGKKTARDLAKVFGTLENLKNASKEKLLNIRDIGDVVCESILQFFSNTQNIEEIDSLLANGVVVQEKEVQTVPDNLFNNKTCVLTGTLEKLDRNKATEILLQLGAKVSGSVSSKTDFVIFGESSGSKLDKANSLGVKTMDETEFYSQLEQIGVKL